MLPRGWQTDWMHRVVALALLQVAAFDLAIPAQIFGHSDQRERYSFALAAEVAGPLPSTTGYAVHAPFGLDALAAADTVIVPGYAPHETPSPPVLDALRIAAGRGTRLVSVCTGAFALAAAGLLDGRQATTHWHDAADLAARYPAVDVNADVLYIDAEAVVRSAGVAAGIDLCLHLLRTDHGEQAAATVARRMVVAPHREGGQAQFLQRPVPAPGTGLAETCTWALHRLDWPLTVTEMANHAGWAPRTFARRFLAETGTTPLRWLVAQRLLQARQLLETTELSVDQVASQCGLGSAVNLRLPPGPRRRQHPHRLPPHLPRTNNSSVLTGPRTISTPGGTRCCGVVKPPLDRLRYARRAGHPSPSWTHPWVSVDDGTADPSSKARPASPAPAGRSPGRDMAGADAAAPPSTDVGESRFRSSTRPQLRGQPRY